MLVTDFAPFHITHYSDDPSRYVISCFKLHHRLKSAQIRHEWVFHFFCKSFQIAHLFDLIII